MFAALQQYADGRDYARVIMVTVTAPGTDHAMPWDESWCRHKTQPHTHSGRFGCRADEKMARAWNESAPRRWSELHQTAALSVQRKHGRPGLLVRAWEYQKRGLLHLHLVFGYTTPSEQRAVDAYVSKLDQLRYAAWFGFVDRKGDVKEPSAAAAYLSSYFVGGKGSKLDIRETVRREDVPSNLIYIAPELMQASGLSMRTLRLRRYLWVKIGSSGLRLCKHLGVSLEDAYIVYSSGFWGRAFLESLMDTSVPS